MLFSHERPIMRVHLDEGWTAERLAEMFPGTLQHHLVRKDGVLARMLSSRSAVEV